MKRAPIVIALLVLTACRAESPIQQATQSPTPATARQERIQQVKAREDGLNKLQNWKPAGVLWKSDSGEIAFRTQEMTEEGITIDHYLTHLCGDEGAPLKDVVDLPSFRTFQGSSFYRDDRRIFHHLSMADGGVFCVLEDVDVASFRVLTGCYARDKAGIYTDKGRKVDADPGSFVTMDAAGCYAKDRGGYFAWGERLSPGAELDDVARKAIEMLGPIQK